MNARWHRAVAGLGLALAGALLSGCHAQGTFDVLSDERVAVDLTVSGPNVNCPNGADALKLTVTTTTDQFGDVVCHVTGETQATYFSTFGITIAPAAEYLVMQASLSGGRDSWPAADIAIRFPGKVVEATQGSVSENTVRITDLAELTQGSGLRAVGLRSSGPPAWLLASLTGVGIGVALTLVVGVVLWLARRPRRVDLSEPPDPPLSSGDAPSVAGTAFVPGVPAGPDPSVERAGTTPLVVTDTSWFARPPAPGKVPNGGEPPVVASPIERAAGHPLQHGAWAPPEDQ